MQPCEAGFHRESDFIHQRWISPVENGFDCVILLTEYHAMPWGFGVVNCCELVLAVYVEELAEGVCISCIAGCDDVLRVKGDNFQFGIYVCFHWFILLSVYCADCAAFAATTAL